MLQDSCPDSSANVEVTNGIYIYHIADILPCDKTLSFVQNNKKSCSFHSVSQEWPKRADKASLLTASINVRLKFTLKFPLLKYDKHIMTCHFSYHTLYQPSFIYHPLSLLALSLIKGMILKMPCNNLYIYTSVY